MNVKEFVSSIRKSYSKQYCLVTIDIIDLLHLFDN